MDQPKNLHVGLALLAMALGGFAIGTGEFVIMGLLPDVAHGLGRSVTSAGNAITSYALGVVVGAPLIAVTGARLARKHLLLGLMTLFTVGNLASAFAPGYYSFILMRFISGLPHGAYFGVASLVAASMVPQQQRGKAIGRMMTGLTIATLLGVPLASWIGHHLSWHYAFLMVGVCALVCVLMMLRYVPYQAGDPSAHPLQELGALKAPVVLMTLLTGSAGFCGMFALFSYITPTLAHEAGMPEWAIPWVMAAFGLGMVVGMMLGGRLSDWSVRKAISVALVWNLVVMVLFPLMAMHVISGMIVTFMIGTTALLIPSLQIRLMDVAGKAQTLAAAMNHSALNIANALGAFLGGVVINAGMGWTSTAWVGGALGILGLVVYQCSLRLKSSSLS
ncbi:MFS transporter [Tatumella saanichensis]|uniref:MFS transporter n=1 Tax=Tatumella saanichensis TaxID=480813 RepID=UPI0004A41F3C|nr:MFS transporter [Tatumella saanichensis]